MKKRKITSFEDLDCWKACRNVRIYVTELIKKFPPEEKYALTDGMRRASRSTTENIAEGFGRYHFQENIQFCRHSRGSLHELIDQLITALDEEHITKSEYSKGRQLIQKALALVNGYINYLRTAKSNIKANDNNMFYEDIASYNI
jgi:four helix bundle protein